MATGNSRRDEIKEQNKKLKDMTFEQKYDHIWGYYKIPIVGTILVIIAAISIFTAIKKNNYDALCTTVIVDGNLTGLDTHEDLLTTGFTQYLGINGTSQRAVFNGSFSLEHQDGDTDAYYSQEKIVSMATAGLIDGYMAEKDYMFYFSDDEELFLTDLSEFYSHAQLEKFGDALIYYTYTDGTKVPVAVDLSETDIIKETDITMEDPCFGIVTTSSHKDYAVKFINYAFGF